jgi:hypothetical protein
MGLLLDFAQPALLANPHYEAVIFRRTYPEITNPGGLLSESQKLYYLLGGRLTLNPLQWTFPSGAKIALRHIQRPSDVYSYQGAQFTRCAFDEATLFEEEQFWYLLSRCRSTSGIKPLMRLTCNPDADSWVARLLDWWIGEDGLPIHERSGQLRWFVRPDTQLVWAGSEEELKEEFPDLQPRSVTFIPAAIHDNPILLETNPDYIANLMALHPIDRERLLGGNWRVRRHGAGLFNADTINRFATGRWEEPVEGGLYVMGIDPAFGTGGDYFVAQVWRVDNLPYRLVAEWRDNTLSIVASQARVVDLIRRYSPAVVAIETNSGGAVLREQLIMALPDVRVEGVVHTHASKRINTDRLAYMLQRHMLQYPRDWHGINEMRQFGLEPRQAMSGHDDCVMAAAVAFAWLTNVLPSHYAESVVKWG